MSLSLIPITSGMTSYVAAHQSNYTAIKTAVDALDALLGGSMGAAISTASALEALFGPSVALIGDASYLCHGSGTTLTVDGGYCWLPTDTLVVNNAGPVTISFSGLSAATYYILVDSSGAPTRVTSGTGAIYSVVWTGSAFGAITRTAALVWSYAEWVAAQTSTALAASYATLDARLEAGETITKASQTTIATYGTGATLTKDTDGTLAANSDTRVATQKATKTYVDAAIGGSGDVVGPGSATNNHVAFFDGTTGKLIKDSGLALSGSNTGDQTSVTGNAGTATALQTARTIGGTSFDGTADITQPFDVMAFYPGIPTASAKVMRIPIGRAVTFPANFAGSYFKASANATATTVFDVQKNGSSIGSVSIAAGGTTATFTTSGGAAQSFAAGDLLAVIAPGTADATLADPGFCFVGTR